MKLSKAYKANSTYFTMLSCWGQFTSSRAWSGSDPVVREELYNGK